MKCLKSLLVLVSMSSFLDGLTITSKSTITVEENSHGMSRVGVISTDAPAGSSLNFSIDESRPANQDYFMMEQGGTGLILKRPLDYETIKELTLFLRVKNLDTEEEARQVLLVRVKDVDEPPSFVRSKYEVEVNLTKDIKYDDHRTLLTVKADDPEGRPVNYSYPCNGCDHPFWNVTVNATTGDIVVAPEHILKAQNGTYNFCVQANDTSLQGYGSVDVHLHVRHQSNAHHLDIEPGDKMTIDATLPGPIVAAIVLSAICFIAIGIFIYMYCRWKNKQENSNSSAKKEQECDEQECDEQECDEPECDVALNTSNL